jgi:hypothetical protein
MCRRKNVYNYGEGGEGGEGSEGSDQAAPPIEIYIYIYFYWKFSEAIKRLEDRTFSKLQRIHRVAYV